MCGREIFQMEASAHAKALRFCLDITRRLSDQTLQSKKKVVYIKLVRKEANCEIFGER